MIDISYLYNPIEHRYRGVYRRTSNNKWDAIVQTPQGVFQRKGSFSSQEEAARAVATYYQSVFGKEWVQALKDRYKKRIWRIRKVTRYLYMQDLHKGPKTVVFCAEIKMPDKSWHKITPKDLYNETEIQWINDKGYWNEKAEGWHSISIALVAIRQYRALHPSSPLPQTK